jgi:hypothetical protein
MNIQLIAVIAIIAAAITYAAITLLRKRRSFSAKSGCGHDCGCKGASK